MLILFYHRYAFSFFTGSNRRVPGRRRRNEESEHEEGDDAASDSRTEGDDDHEADGGTDRESGDEEVSSLLHCSHSLEKTWFFLIGDSSTNNQSRRSTRGQAKSDIRTATGKLLST